MVRQPVRWWKALENVAGISNYLSLLDLWNEFRALGLPSSSVRGKVISSSCSEFRRGNHVRRRNASLQYQRRGSEHIGLC
jgi:hypothetical protein